MTEHSNNDTRLTPEQGLATKAIKNLRLLLRDPNNSLALEFLQTMEIYVHPSVALSYAELIVDHVLNPRIMEVERVEILDIFKRNLPKLREHVIGTSKDRNLADLLAYIQGKADDGDYKNTSLALALAAKNMGQLIKDTICNLPEPEPKSEFAWVLGPVREDTVTGGATIVTLNHFRKGPRPR